METRADVPEEAMRAARDPANIVGRYVRVRAVGRGGMGEVWKAWDASLGRWTALKLIRAPGCGRVHREARLAAGLCHPNIASVFEVGEEDGLAFIAMQYIEGRTLSEPSADRRTTVASIRDAALAVHYAHEHGIIHRDLKPENLIVEEETGRLYVLDFGLAKRLSVRSSISGSGMALGTPVYMSPEQAAGLNSEIDGRSDVYSLGAVLYRCLSGRAPFQGDLYRVIRSVLEEPAPALHQVDQEADRDLETIVMKCLEKEPRRRYATARELGTDLTHWLAGEPIEARPPSMLHRAGRFLRRRSPILGAFAAGMAVGIAGVLALTSSAP